MQSCAAACPSASLVYNLPLLRPPHSSAHVQPMLQPSLWNVMANHRVVMGLKDLALLVTEAGFKDPSKAY